MACENPIATEFYTLDEHNYANAPLQAKSSGLFDLETPIVSDDYEFINDLLPMPSSSPSGSLKSQKSSSDQEDQLFFENALPDLCMQVDHETLAEAFCFLDMPQPSDKTAEQVSSVMSTMSELFSSFTPTSNSANLLPVHTGDCDDAPSASNSISSNSSHDAYDSSLQTLTEEERILLEREGVYVPNGDEIIVFTDEQEKILKAVRRKIRNKELAKESRKRKANYIDTLEKRMKKEQQSNATLQSKVAELEHENETLSTRLQYMQSFVQKLVGTMKNRNENTAPKKSTHLLVFLLAFCLIMGPERFDPDSFPSPSSLGQFTSNVSQTSGYFDTLQTNSANGRNSISFIFTYDPIDEPNMGHSGDL